jgi:hypothetical protein
MRLTPAQLAMASFLGEWLPHTSEQSVKERIAHGHRFLVQITREDFGFDPQRWHDFLRQTNAGGYRWSNKHLGFPRRIVRAINDPDWQAAVAELRINIS